MNKGGSVLQRYRFPIQDHGLKEGREVVNPETVAAHGPQVCGSVHAIDELGLVVTLKRSKKQLLMGTPNALIPFDYFRTDGIRDSLLRTGEWVLANGLDAPGARRAALDLLTSRPPRTREREAPLQRADEKPLEAAVRLGLELDGGSLAIQGPPGSGKTYTAARMIVALVRDGRRVGVTANSHKVIGNALDKIHEAAREAGVTVRIGQKASADEPPTCTEARPLASNAAARDALLTHEVDVVGGTAWMWAASELEGSVDVLFVDEAGQFSLASAIAVAPAARSIVLLGDPQQLDQPLQGSHPPGAERSALGHVLDGAPVIRNDLRPVPHRHVAHAPGRLRIHLRAVLRGSPRLGADACPSGAHRRAARERDRHALAPGRARGRRDGVHRRSHDHHEADPGAPRRGRHVDRPQGRDQADPPR